MSNNHDPRRNHEHYSDPTAYAAIAAVAKEDKAKKQRKNLKKKFKEKNT